jgi:hypothetical protein
MTALRMALRHARESGHPVRVPLKMNISGAAYWIIRFRG